MIGSGFIGCEAAASLANRGLDVIMITDEDVPHTSRLGPEAGSEIAGWLRADGVTVRAGAGVAALDRRSTNWVITLVDGDRLLIPADRQPATRVRYAWADSPVVNLFDARPLPVPGFELPIER